MFTTSVYSVVGRYGRLKTSPVNEKAFREVKKALESGDLLTLDAIGLIFGVPFYQLLVVCLLDAQEAALAISGSIRRLSDGGLDKSSQDIRDEISKV